MSVLAHPGSFGLPTRRRHLTLVPQPAPERLAEVIELPVRAPARAPEQLAPLRLTARGRRVLASLAIVGAAVVGGALGAVANAAAEPATDVRTVTVSSGDTLWGIASQIAAPGEDVRDVMAQIAALNDLEGTDLAAGQQLTVPAGD